MKKDSEYSIDEILGMSLWEVLTKIPADQLDKVCDALNGLRKEGADGIDMLIEAAEYIAIHND